MSDIKQNTEEHKKTFINNQCFKKIKNFNNWVVENKAILDRVDTYIQEFNPCLLDLTDINDIYYYFYMHSSTTIT